MALSSQGKRALVTGGAGLIGSHIVDLLQGEDWPVRILDNLEPQTHRNGKPPWLQAAIENGAEFIEGDMRDRRMVEEALAGIDVVFHEAAYGGYMPEIAKYVAVNSLGTAQLLEIIREKSLAIQKVIVASSQDSLSGRGGRMPRTWTGISWVETAGTASARRLLGPLSGVPDSDPIRAHARVRATRRRNGLRHHQSGSGKTGARLGKAGWDFDGGTTLLVHLRSAAVDF
jgi:NAD(P)-dependent dehydrogenase (short-subunit alcohol dehydrogenase family)